MEITREMEGRGFGGAEWGGVFLGGSVRLSRLVSVSSHLPFYPFSSCLFLVFFRLSLVVRFTCFPLLSSSALPSLVKRPCVFIFSPPCHFLTCGFLCFLGLPCCLFCLSLFGFRSFVCIAILLIYAWSMLLPAFFSLASPLFSFLNSLLTSLLPPFLSPPLQLISLPSLFSLCSSVSLSRTHLADFSIRSPLAWFARLRSF